MILIGGLSYFCFEPVWTGLEDLNIVFRKGMYEE